MTIFRMSTRDVHTYLSVLLAMITQCRGSMCPSDLVAEVSACIANLTGSTKHVMAGADVEQLLTECRQGNFATTVECIDVLYDMCTEEKDLVILKNLASPNFMRESFRFFCSNFDHYVNSSRCIRNLDPEIQDCINEEYALLNTRLKRRKILHDVLPVYCRYLHETTSCIENPVRRDCDSHTADIIIVFTDGIRPPMCDRYSSSGNECARPWLVHLVLCLFLLYRKNC